MKLNKRRIALAVGIFAALGVSFSFASGLWSTLPIVSYPSYCASFSTTFGGQTCSQTVPAGPTALTGGELVPADISPSVGGAPPATVLLTMPTLGAGPTGIVTLPAASTTTVTVSNTQRNLILLAASTVLSSTTVIMPPLPVEGQRLGISANQTINTLVLTTVNAVGSLAVSAATISNNPTVLTTSTTAAYGYQFIYDSANTAWRRLQ